MTLPRFTSGKVGKLEFHHLNEAFDRIENVEPLMPPSTRQILGRVILARVNALSGTGNATIGSFQEVAVTSPGTNIYAAVNGGVSSTVGGNAFGAPIVFPVSAAGSIVPVLGHIAADGKLYFRECSATSASASVRVGEVISSIEIVSNKMWYYQLQDVAITNIQQGTYQNITGSFFQALNGCEQPSDAPSQRLIGVGTIHVAGSLATRQKIRNGTIVVCVPSGNGFVFSVPNGYSFSCI